MDEFVLEFKKMQGDDSPRRPLMLSSAAADAMRVQLKGREKHIERHDKDGKFIEMIDKNEIKGIRMANQDSEKDFQRYAICDYGTRHPHKGREGWEDCECDKRFVGMSTFQYRKILEKNYPEVEYSGDITEEMQHEMEKLCIHYSNPKQ